MAVRWERVEDGIYRRKGREGKPIYRAVRQAGRDPETRRYVQEVATFNGAKVQNALREARLWRANGAVQLEAGPVPTSRASRLTLQEAYNALHADPRVQYAPSTVQLHEDLWKALRAATPALLGRQLKEIDVRSLRATLSKIEAPSMRDKARQLVGLIYRHADVSPNPAVKEYTPRTRAARMAEAREEGRYLEDGAVERLVAAMPDRYRTLTRVLWRIGLRPGEAFAMTVGQFDPERRVLTIDRAVNGGVVGATKTGRTRRPVLPRSVAEELVEHIRVYSDWTRPDGLVFSTEAGTMIDADNFRRRVFAAAAREAGVAGAKPYDLRHTACSNAIAAGVDVVTVAEMTGHSVDVLVRTYAHYVERAGREAADKLDVTYRATSSVPAIEISSAT